MICFRIKNYYHFHPTLYVVLCIIYLLQSMVFRICQCNSNKNETLNQIGFFRILGLTQFVLLLSNLKDWFDLDLNTNWLKSPKVLIDHCVFAPKLRRNNYAHVVPVKTIFIGKRPRVLSFVNQISWEWFDFFRFIATA